MSLNLLRASFVTLALSLGGSASSSGLSVRVDAPLPSAFELPLESYLAQSGADDPESAARSAHFAGSAAFFLIQIGAACIDNICLTLQGELVDGKIIVESLFYSARDVSVESMIFPIKGPLSSVATFRVHTGYFTVYRTSRGFEYFAVPNTWFHNAMTALPDGKAPRPAPLESASNFDAFRKSLERRQ